MRQLTKLLLVPYLNGRDFRRQDETLIVPVNHDEHPDRSCRNSPRVLVNKLLFLRLRILEHDVKHLREVLSEVVGRGALYGAAARRHKRLHRRRVISSGKLLLLRLLTPNYGDSEVLLVNLRHIEYRLYTKRR